MFRSLRTRWRSVWYGRAIGLMTIRVLAIGILGMALLFWLQGTTPSTAQTPSAPDASQGAAPPYDDELRRLAEILGGLHYLRPLCGVQGEGQRWRDEMTALLEAEQPSASRRGQLIASFNRGYAGFANVYRSCTPSARLAVQRHLKEGARLAHEVVVRYGGN